jgi:putative transposase
MKDWRYEIILGLDFLVAIDAVIHVSKGEISVKRDKVVNAADTVVQHKARSSYKLIAKQDVVVRPGHEARLVAEIDSAPPEFIYLIRGKHIATGVYEVSPFHELVVFYRAGTTPHVIKKGEILGKAEPIPESVKNIFGHVNAVAQDEQTSTDSEAAIESNMGEKKIKQVSEEELRESLKKLKVGNLNKKKFFHIFKKYAYAFDGKDPGLKELRRRRRGKKFWMSPESKGRIFTPSDINPIYIPQFRQSPFHLQEAERMTAEWLERELVRHSYSSWNSPVLMIPKPKGGLRMCVDYRQLNAASETDSYPMPRIDEILDSLGKAVIFSKIDLRWGFFNIELREEDKAKTAFSLRSGHYEWNVLPMGLKNSPAIFQRIMTEVLRPYIGKFVHVFVDDILIYSENPTQHYKHLELVVKAIAENGFKVAVDKSEFGMESLENLGFQITKDKILLLEAQVDAILKMEQPKNISELRSFTGMCNVLRWLIKDFATLTAPLEDLKKKGASVTKDWTDIHTRTFDNIKAKIAGLTGNYRIDWNKPVHFCSDASDVGIGAYVFQIDDDGSHRPLHYWSRKLTASQKNYSTQERECFALIEGLKALNVYVDGREFDIYMDHSSLQYLMQSRYQRRKMSAWAMELQEYKIRDIIHIPGKDNAIADCLSRLPMTKFVEEPFSDEKFADTNRYAEKNPKNKDEQESINFIANPVGVWSPIKTISNLEEVKTEQRKDEFLSKIFLFLENKLDLNDPASKEILFLSQSFVVENELLYFLHKQRFKPLQKRLCIPTCLKERILAEIHEKGGHQGVNRTYELLHDRFWWKNMYRDVCTHIQGCECRKRKLTSNSFKNLKGEHIVVRERWHTLAIDWLYVGRRGKYGSFYVLSIVDLFTRFSLGIPAVSKDGSSLVRILRMVFGMMGYPRRIVSDNESMFRSIEFKEWLIVKGIEKTFTVVYNPRANGIDERFNQTLMNMINSACPGNHWDVDIWDLFYFYNLANQATTDVSPFFLQYVRKGNLPVDLTYDTNKSEEFYSYKDLTRTVSIELSKATERAIKEIEKKHGKLDNRLKMNKFRPFKEGDKVIIKEPNLETQAKRKPIGTGPWTIHRVMGKNTYKVKEANGKKLKFLVNGRRMALIVPRRKMPKQDKDKLEYFDMMYFKEDPSRPELLAQAAESPPPSPIIAPKRTRPKRGLLKEVYDAQEQVKREERRRERRGERPRAGAQNRK